MSNSNHMGASTEAHAWKYLHQACCIYSGNTGPVYSTWKNLTEKQQEQLNYEFMKKHCMCERCVSDREHKKKLILKLKEDKDFASLKALGIDV